MYVVIWSFVMMITMVLITSQPLAPIPGRIPGHNGEMVTKLDTEMTEVPPTTTKTSSTPEYQFDSHDSDVSNDSGYDKVVGTPKGNNEPQSPLDPWSIVWYIGSFGGLIAFFLIVSCSEWFCRRGARPSSVPYRQRSQAITGTSATIDTPPPPYHLFAPPPYDSITYTDIDKTSGEKVDIYVISVPIHQAAVGPAPA